MSDKGNPIVFLFKKMWEYSKGNRHMVVLYIVLFSLANLMSFIEPLVIAKILNIIQESGANKKTLTPILLYLLAFLGIDLAFWAFHGPARIIERANAFLARANYKKYLLDGTMDLSAEWHTDHHSGDTIDKIEKGTHSLYRFSGSTFEVIETIFRLMGSYIALIYFNLHASYLVFFFVFVTVILIIKFDKYIMNCYKQLNLAENRISAKIFDIISNITTVIILRIEKLVSKSIFKKIMYPFTLYNKTNKINEFKWFLVSMLATLMAITVMGSYIFFNIRAGNVILIGTVFALYEYVRRINTLFFRFAYRYTDIVIHRTRIANAELISNEFKEKIKVKQKILKKNWNEIKINNLNFSYHTEKRKDLHLNNISMNIKRKQRIALVGHSGSGKTTILKVMRDLYTPHQVEVQIDNLKLKHGFKSIEDNITLIPQDPEIFSTTIKENITVGIQHPISYIKKYTNMAQFTRVVNRLPKKWNSNIVEKGVNLSGGEKQRLALARGLLAAENKEIVFLDEPTSSVDSKNELKIYENMFKKFKDKTILSSIHRLHLLHLFDKIYYFRRGKIVAEGSFKSLLKTSLEFKKLWDKYNKTRK